MTKSKINSSVKDNLNLVVNEMLSGFVLLNIKIEEVKQTKKKQAVEKFFGKYFELNKDNKISIHGKISELEKSINNTRATLLRTSNLVTTTVSSIRKLETESYAMMSKILDKIDRLDFQKSTIAIVMSCKNDTEKIQVAENIYVKNILDYKLLNEQQATFQLFLDGILQVNDTADKGDYLLSVDEKNNIEVSFHEIIPSGTSISIFAVKSR